MDNVAKTAKPHITLMGADKYGIRISRYVLKALGWPTYICFLKSEDKKSIALVSCKKEQPLSMKVPEDISTNAERKMRVYCKPLQMILTRRNPFWLRESIRMLSTLLCFRSRSSEKR